MVSIKLFGHLKERIGLEKLEVEASSWREALLKAREVSTLLREAIDDTGEPVPGYVVFVDGVDYRLLKPDESAREIVIIPVVHGGRVFER
ncbi:MAG: MoaD/ThiS family protein [Acidilobaceae archaeon]